MGYIVKAFKSFEVTHEPADSLDAAQQRFEQLYLGGQYDALYVQDEQGRIALAWAANYDEPGGGHLEKLGYLRRVGMVRVRADSDYGVFVFEHPEHGRISHDGGMFPIVCNRDAAKTICGLLNQLEVMNTAVRAAREALTAADAEFARQVLEDAGEIEGWRWSGNENTSAKETNERTK